MVTFSDITKVEGGFKCPCGIVWLKDYQAIGCQNHGHVEGYVIHSPYDGPPTAWSVSPGSRSPGSREVRALRREG